jgi:hypothetical protein
VPIPVRRLLGQFLPVRRTLHEPERCLSELVEEFYMQLLLWLIDLMEQSVPFITIGMEG